MLTLTYPAHFPDFVESQINAGMAASDVRYLLEKPHKWDAEFTRFAEQREGQTLTQSVGDLAHSLGIGAGDVFDAMRKAGVTTFYIEGQRYDAEEALKAIDEQWRWDATRDVEVDLTPPQVAALCKEWDVSEADFRSGKRLAEERIG